MNAHGNKYAFLLFAAALLGPRVGLRADLGLPRDAYGVWDRSGFNTVAQYPFTRGQSYSETWFNVNKARGVFDWTALDRQLAFADAQNEKFIVQILTVGGSKGSSMPAWMFLKNGGDVPSLSDDTYTYGYYLHPRFRVYFEEMVNSLAAHLRTGVPASQRPRIAFVRVDTGATGDEEPYENANAITPAADKQAFGISAQQWREHRLWAFEVYRKAFQEGPGPVIPLLFQDIESTGFPVEWTWVNRNVKGGFGAKYGGQVRGHHLTGSQEVSTSFRSIAVDPAPGMRFFSRNEMDQTWSKPFFQLNLRLNLYWTAVEQLHAGQSIWDVTESCLQRTTADDIGFAFEFFNKWAAELVPATAGGGFCILHQGLDASDKEKFPAAAFGGQPDNANNQARYLAICQAYAAQGARMDDVVSATNGQVYQRDNQTGFNDAGWGIVPGNYERFITQINPDATSKALWRVNGPLTKTSHPYDRFARGFDHASSRDTMSFDIHDKLLPSPGQPVQIAVTYLNRGNGQFALRYDAAADSQKTAFTVTKTNQGDWVTRSVVVTDWAFRNRGPGGADLMLVNTDAEDDVFHGLELIKLTALNVTVAGQGSVTGRHNAAAFTPLPATVMEGQRIELAATPAPGWEFAGWSGALSGTDPRPFLFPSLLSTELTATFVRAGETPRNTARLTNLSARVAVGGAAGTPIPGFVLSGPGEKAMLIRAVGPTLTALGVGGALTDPRFTLYRGTATLSGNDNWSSADASAMTATGAFALAAGSRDAALLNALPAGAYTAPVTATDGGSGIALLEVYEASASETVVLVNGSTRAHVGTGESVLIPGFVIGGSGNLRLIIRAVGPTLADFGVTEALVDPTMTLFRGATPIATNDNWSEAGNAAEITATARTVGAFALPGGSRDAVILTSLPPGAYTVVISGVGATSGTVLVELYAVP